EQLDQSLSPLLQAGHRPHELIAQRRREARGERVAALDVRQYLFQRDEEVGVGGRANVMAVEVLELGEIEASRRASDLRKIEGADHLLGGEYLLVAMAPA